MKALILMLATALPAAAPHRSSPTAVAVKVAGSHRSTPATDAAARCFVAGLTADDRVAMLRWMLANLSADPRLRNLFAVSDQQRGLAEQKAADIFHRLLRTDCHSQAVAAVRADGDDALENAYDALGDSLGDDFENDPALASAIERFAAGFDKEAQDIASEAKMHP